MDVEIVNFPETKIAVIEHRGPAQFEHESVKNLVAWRIENKLPPSDIHRSYGIHYNDPQKVAPPEYRVDLCVSVEQEISINEAGVLNKVIPLFVVRKYVITVLARMLRPLDTYMSSGFLLAVSNSQNFQYSFIMSMLGLKLRSRR